VSEKSYWYGIQGVRHGPVSFLEIQQLVQSGHLQPTDYIWNEQHQIWTRVMDFPHAMDPPSAREEAPAPTFSGHDVGAPPFGEQHEEALDFADEEYEAPVEYAGFWIRAGAFIIDGFALGFVGMIWFFIAYALGLLDNYMALADSAEKLSLHEIWAALPWTYYAVSTLIAWLYEALLLSSSWQATVGKRAMGIQVVDSEGGRCSFARASLRFFIKNFVSGWFFFGYLLVLTNERKQALHDMVAGTFCEKL
jgi:uncharacterized RDD family membrane protein YckC